MREIFVAIILLLLLSLGCAQVGLAGGNATPAPAPAYDFSLETLTGETITLSDLQGRWVLVNFWATWCKPCVEEMPYLQQIAGERNMTVLGVNFNEPPETVVAFVAEHAISFPILMNPDDITLLMYQARSLPRTVVIAPDGTIAHQMIGEINPAEFEVWLDKQLNEVAERQ